jgi:hypothetical protein
MALLHLICESVQIGKSVVGLGILLKENGSETTVLCLFCSLVLQLTLHPDECFSRLVKLLVRGFKRTLLGNEIGFCGFASFYETFVETLFMYVLVCCHWIKYTSKVLWHRALKKHRTESEAPGAAQRL